MSIKENKELVRRYMSVDKAKIREDLAAGKDEFHAPEFILHISNASIGDMNLKEYRQYMAAAIEAFPDLKYSTEDIIAEGDKVVVRYKFSGTHKGTMQGIAPTGKKVSYEGIWIIKINKGKLSEVWGVADTLEMMQQMGAIPAAPPKK